MTATGEFYLVIETTDDGPRIANDELMSRRQAAAWVRELQTDADRLLSVIAVNADEERSSDVTDDLLQDIGTEIFQSGDRMSHDLRNLLEERLGVMHVRRMELDL